MCFCKLQCAAQTFRRAEKNNKSATRWHCPANKRSRLAAVVARRATPPNPPSAGAPQAVRLRKSRRFGFNGEGVCVSSTLKVGKASTQTQALCALLFLYGPVSGQELNWIENAIHAKRPTRLPMVLTRDEVKRILSEMRGTAAIVGKILYGSGLRLNEALTLRVKDIGFARGEILVWDGKGRKDQYSYQLRDKISPILHIHLFRPWRVGSVI